MLCTENSSGVLTDLIRALCLDYFRRDECIRHSSVSRRVRMELVFINTKLLEGAGEIVGGSLAEGFILEIGKRIGYAKSRFDYMSEATYKKHKKEVIENIGRKLFLSD